MKKYKYTLVSNPSNSFRCKKAAQSVDIDIQKKLQFTNEIEADVENDFNIGLIIGASGNGKTTLAKHIYGEDCFTGLINIDENKTVLDQINKKLTYNESMNILCGVGLSQIPCCIRPIKTLSNGQKERAKAAIHISYFKENNKTIVIDEWTSTVDRIAAKAMSVAINKSAIKNNIKIVLISCHKDIVEYVNPDWIIDVDEKKYIDRRLLRRKYERKEKLQFFIKRCRKEAWRNFAKYHYLNENLPGGIVDTFGLYDENEQQIGFQCFANYVPGKKFIVHSNRTVILPEYTGFGLGIKLINETSDIMKNNKYTVMAKFSSIPVKKSFDKYKDKWELLTTKIKTSYATGTISKSRNKTIRHKVKYFTYKYIG